MTRTTTGEPREVAAGTSPFDGATSRPHDGHLDDEEGFLLSRSLIASLPVPLLSTDAYGHVVRANQAAACLLTTTVGSSDRAPVFLSLDDASRCEAQSLLDKAVGTRRDVHGSLVFSAHGSGMECQVTLVPAVPPDDASATAGEQPVVDVVRWVVVPAGDTRTGAADISVTPVDPVLVELCRLGIGQADLRALLSRVTKLIGGGLPTVDAASITLGDPGRPALLASSCTVAQAGDAVQHYAGDGPVFDAYLDGRPVGTDDLVHDPQWSLRAPDGVDQTPRHCLALPFSLEGSVAGVLALYGRGPLARDTLTVCARPYLATVEALVRDTRLLEDVVTTRNQFQEALTSRSEIDEAKGIIMGTCRCSADTAFALLVRASNTTHRKVREVAHDLVARAVGDGKLFLGPPECP